MRRTDTEHLFPLRPRQAHLAGLALSCAALLAPSTLLASDAEAAATLSKAERKELIALLEQARDETLELVRPVEGDDWTRRPGADRWSVGEVVEHVVRAEAIVRQRIERILATEADPDWQTVDAMPLATILDPIADRSRKFQAPEPIQPSGEWSRDELIAKLEEARAETIDWVRSTDAPLKSHTGDTPLGQKVSARAWVAFIAGHNRRHNQQILEILETR